MEAKGRGPVTTIKPVVELAMTALSVTLWPGRRGGLLTRGLPIIASKRLAVLSLSAPLTNFAVMTSPCVQASVGVVIGNKTFVPLRAPALTASQPGLGAA